MSLRGVLYGALAAGTLAAGASGVWAQPVDPVELQFWQSVENSPRPEEYQAYLDAYPNGHFAAFARSRLGTTTRVPLGKGTVAAAPDPASPARVAGVVLRLTRSSVRLVNGVTLDLDAQALRDSSNLRVAVVPARSPDAIADPDAFVLDSSPVRPTRQRLTVPSGPPGADEVRLYHIPRFGSAFQVAARAPVTIGPGVPGAILSRDLAREAVRLGPLRFEANHRDRPLVVQAAFLRAKPRTEWNVAWLNGMLQQVPAGQLMVISIGQPNVVKDAYGTTGETVCVLAANDAQALDRLATLETGDPVVVRGVPTSWSSAAADDPVVLRDCSIAG